MRVISGTSKGRRLKIPPENISRPTADRVKEALFNILGERVFGSIFLDCFAGSGSIGIEALSRGAAEVHFIEKNPIALKILRENLANTGFMEASKVWKGDMGKVIQKSLREIKFDIIFLDPPYNLDPLPILNFIEKKDLPANKGIVILELSKKSNPVDLNFWRLAENRTYGDTRLQIWQKE